MTTTTGEAGGLKRLRSIIGGCAGNLVEWYDWSVYTYFALYFAKAFFPKGDQTAQFMSAAAVLAVGFLMRPIGAWLMGEYADKKGRKAALTLSVALMSFGSLLIAVSPTYAHIGSAAAVLLVIARLVQGVSLGGEYGASATYLSEISSRKWRGFWGSWQYVTMIMGQLSALGLLVVMQTLMSVEDLTAWGWRIPFVIGAILSVTVFWLRRTMEESHLFEAEAAPADKRSKTLLLFLRHPKETAMVMGLTAGGSLSFYVFTTYMPKFLVNTAGYAKDQASQIVAFTLFLFMCLQPAFGALSDKIGRKPLLITFGVLGSIMPWPIMTALAQTHDPAATVALIMAALLVVSCYSSISGLFKAELFPTGVRALGVALPYALANSIFGGSAEYVGLWFKDIGHEPYYYVYVSVVVAGGLLIALGIRETKTHSRIEHG